MQEQTTLIVGAFEPIDLGVVFCLFVFGGGAAYLETMDDQANSPNLISFLACLWALMVSMNLVLLIQDYPNFII